MLACTQRDIANGGKARQCHHHSSYARSSCVEVSFVPNCSSSISKRFSTACKPFLRNKSLLQWACIESSLWFCSPMLAAAIIADPPSKDSLHLASFNSAPMLELAYPCKSTRNPKQDRHYRWDRCGCLYDTPHLCAVYSNAVKNPLNPFCRPSRTLFSTFQCPPPRWRNFSLRFQTIVQRVLYRICLWRGRRGAISMTDQITNNSHPSTTTTDPSENPKSSNPRAAAN